LRRARVLLGPWSRPHSETPRLSLRGCVFRIEETAKDFLEALWSYEPDVVALNVDGNGLDGKTVLNVIRTSPRLKRAAVMALLPRFPESRAREVLKEGADDAMFLPLHAGEFLARVKTLLDRGFPYDASDRLRSRDIVLESRSRRVSAQGRSLKLTPTEFELLEALMRQKGRVLNKRALAASLWAGPPELRRHLLDCHMFNLRRKLGRASRRIEILPGVGYRFIP
jgi:two-component system, OmpR family, KDP operon response regulator KdpE